MDERQRLEQRICDLKSQLECTSSAIGDWKIAKCMECQIAGLPLPYDIDELHEARQKVRDEINEIQNHMKEMDIINPTIEI